MHRQSPARPLHLIANRSPTTNDDYTSQIGRAHVCSSDLPRWVGSPTMTTRTPNRDASTEPSTPAAFDRQQIANDERRLHEPDRKSTRLLFRSPPLGWIAYDDDANTQPRCIDRAQHARCI